MAGLSFSASRTSRAEIALTSRGLIAETWPQAINASTRIPVAGTTNGTLALGLVGLRGGETVTNLLCIVQTNGASLTFVKMGLYSSTGTFLAATAESSSSFNSGTTARAVSLALTAPYPVTADGGYYIGFLQFGSGATGAALIGSGGQGGDNIAVGGSVRASAHVSAQTDISGNVTPADGSTTQTVWLACN